MKLRQHKQRVHYDRLNLSFWTEKQGKYWVVYRYHPTSLKGEKEVFDMTPYYRSDATYRVSKSDFMKSLAGILVWDSDME